MEVFKMAGLSLQTGTPADYPNEKRKKGRWQTLHQYYEQSPKNLTEDEVRELNNLDSEYGSYGQHDATVHTVDAQREQQRSNSSDVSDKELKDKYGFNIKQRLTRLFVKPEKEWLEEKRDQYEMEQAGRKVFNSARTEAYQELQAEKGFGKYSTKSQLAKQKAEEMLMQKRQKQEEYKLQQQQIAVERQRLGLEHQKISLEQHMIDAQSSRRGSAGGGFGLNTSPMAGLGAGVPRGWTTYAGLEKFSGGRSGGMSGMPDFSRFTNPDPTAGLSKLWAQNQPQQAQQVVRKFAQKTKKHKKKRRR
jgi:hypothetical protein